LREIRIFLSIQHGKDEDSTLPTLHNRDGEIWHLQGREQGRTIDQERPCCTTLARAPGTDPRRSLAGLPERRFGLRTGAAGPRA
jgi:hypothetical protein